MANCTKCKAELPDGALFCPMCGKKQTADQRKHRKRANGSGTIYKMAGNRSKPYAAKRNNIFLGSYKTYKEAQKALERTTDADMPTISAKAHNTTMMSDSRNQRILRRRTTPRIIKANMA